MTSWRPLGPGLIVTAAFIGPGTVTTATVAGARFGTTLLWALLFATVATIVLQEMAARLGLTTGAGLGRALRAVRGPSWLGITLASLAAVAVASGAVAFQAGNLTGAGLGLDAVTGISRHGWIGIGAILAGALLWSGRYKLVERVLGVCVAIMGLVFLTTAILVAPSVVTLLRDAVVPRLPADAELTAIGLIGTTIVPYNLFLHAAAVNERWSDVADLPAVRWDLILAIGLGGIVSGAVVVTAAAALDGARVESATDMARQLTPLLGPWAGHAFALGYAAAGLTSAITAPLAAAYAVLDAMGRGRETRGTLARGVWGTCMIVGGGAALLGTRPVPLILFAQVLNGLILPVVALVLLIAMNDQRRLGAHVNGWKGNAAGGIVVLLCVVLGMRAVMGAF